MATRRPSNGSATAKSWHQQLHEFITGMSTQPAAVTAPVTSSSLSVPNPSTLRSSDDGATGTPSLTIMHTPCTSSSVRSATQLAKSGEDQYYKTSPRSHVPVISPDECVEAMLPKRVVHKERDILVVVSTTSPSAITTSVVDSTGSTVTCKPTTDPLSGGSAGAEAGVDGIRSSSNSSAGTSSSIASSTTTSIIGASGTPTTDQNNVCFSNSWLQPLYGSYIAVALTDRTCTVSSLDLSRNELGDAGVTLLSFGLKHNRTLQSLNLSYNNIGGEGLRSIAACRMANLRKLALSGNRLIGQDPVGLISILETFKNLSTLILKDVGLRSSQEIGMGLQQNSNLLQLILRGNSVDMEFLVQALKVPHVHLMQLDVSHNQITDEGAKLLADALKTSTVLAHVDLSGNSIRYEGAIALAGSLRVNRSLICLRLNDNKIGQYGLESIASSLFENQCLWELALGGLGNTSHAIECMCEALKKNTGLLHLNLTRNTFDKTGFDCLTTMLKNNSTLRCLNLSCTQLTPPTLSSLAEAINISSVQHLNISDNNEIIDSQCILDLIVHSAKLQFLSISNLFTDAQSDSLITACKSSTIEHYDFGNLLEPWLAISEHLKLRQQQRGDHFLIEIKRIHGNFFAILGSCFSETASVFALEAESPIDQAPTRVTDCYCLSDTTLVFSLPEGMRPPFTVTVEVYGRTPRGASRLTLQE
ncbi:Protein NLRC3 [Pelomyxa schiedti]|nr:Protein NLRC3 [Pelomyxa schiedti]